MNSTTRNLFVQVIIIQTLKKSRICYELLDVNYKKAYTWVVGKK